MSARVRGLAPVRVPDARAGDERVGRAGLFRQKWRQAPAELARRPREARMPRCGTLLAAIGQRVRAGNIAAFAIAPLAQATAPAGRARAGGVQSERR
jgi:hypothetical protein